MNTKQKEQAELYLELKTRGYYEGYCDAARFISLVATLSPAKLRLIKKALDYRKRTLRQDRKLDQISAARRKALR